MKFSPDAGFSNMTVLVEVTVLWIGLIVVKVQEIQAAQANNEARNSEILVALGWHRDKIDQKTQKPKSSHTASWMDLGSDHHSTVSIHTALLLNAL